jgi:phosphinothricin acetyltransferase
VPIRDARPEDAAAIAAIYNESIAAGDSTMDQTPHTARDVLGWMKRFNDRETLLVMNDADEIVGWGILKRYSSRPGYRFCCETSVYVRRNHRGRGCGSRLQAALMNRCRAYGYHHVVAKIWAGNEASLSLHRKFGFELVGIQREIGFHEGRWIDVAILQCLLDDLSPNAPST